jgi:hypothetical protein
LDKVLFIHNLTSSTMKREIKRLVSVLITTAICALMAAQSPGGVSSGLQVWLKADAGTSTTTNGANISSWSDQSGNGRNATMATSSKQPVYHSSVVNGLPAIYTNGGPRFLELDLSSIANGEFTIFAVTQRATSNIFNYFIGIYPGVSSNGNLSLGFRQSSQSNLTLPTGSSRGTITGYAGANEPATAMWTDYSSTATRRVTLTQDGVEKQVTGSGGTITAQTGIGQIGRGSNTAGFNGYISEIIVYNRVLTSTERNQIQTYLAVKYGLAASSSVHLYYNEPGYNNDIFGLGRDLATQGLNVTTSNSVSVDDIMEVRNPSSLDDGDYLIFGNNNGTGAFTAHSGSNCLYSSALNRSWKVNKVNDAGTVTMRFDMTGITGFVPEELALVIDADGDGIDDETALTGTYTAPYFEVNNVSISDGAIVRLVQQKATWYAITSGNASDAIWSTSTSGPAQILSTTCEEVSLVIRPGITVTNNWPTLTCKNLTIDGTGILNAGSGQINLKGSLTVNGTLNAQTSTVVFVGTSAQTLTGTNLVNLYNLTVNNSTGLTMSNTVTGVYLRGNMSMLAGDVTTNNKLTLISDVSGTGMIGTIVSGSVIGDVTVQRYHQSTNVGWINLCSPVQGQTLQGWNDDLVTTGFPGSDNPPPYSFNNVQYYNESLPGGINTGYVGATDISNPIVNNRGYFIYQPQGTMTVDVTGAINTGDQSLPVTFTNSGNVSADGWNLIGNPYPCAIDWNDADWSKTNINNAVYIYNAATGLYASYVNGVASNGGSRFIPSSQSFFVVANAAGPVLTAREGVKANVNGTFRSADATPESLSLQLSDGIITDEVVLSYNQESSDRFDGSYDAFKLRSPIESAPYFAAISGDGYDLSVYTTPQPTMDMIIPLRMEVGVTGTYTITPRNLNSFGKGACFVLEDILNGTVYPLREAEGIELNLMAGAEQLRFQLRIGAAAITHITGAGCPGQNAGQVEFNAQRQDGIQIEWLNNIEESVVSAQVVKSTERLEGLEAGSYTALIHNNGVCGTTRATFDIVQNEDLEAMANIVPVSCRGRQDGSIEVDVLGGSGDYDLTWSNGQKGSHVEHLPVGECILFVRDASGCEKTFEYQIPVLNELTANFETISSVFEMLNGAVEVDFYNTSVGATTFEWVFGDATISNAQNNCTHLFNQKGIYDVTLIAKNNDCESRQTKQIKIAEAKNNGSELAADVLGRLTDNGIELRFFLDGPHKLRITAYNMLGQQIVEPFTNIYQNETIYFSDKRYAANSIVEILDMETGERAIIRMAN